MQRTVFQESPIDGFRSQKTETIAFSAIGSGKSFYSGSPDGVLSLYQLNTDASTFIIFVISHKKKKIENMFLLLLL